MLARYTISNELGRSATGAVYAARDRTTGALVALRRLDPAMEKSDPGFAERFLKHARTARKLRHRNIVRIHDAAEAGGTVYVAMEMLEGESLRKILADGPLPIARAIRIAHDIACGLAHAHLQGMAHGALKPSSIMVLRSGEAKITDFGQPSATAAAGYLSPEQLRGEPASHRSDIFSLGALLYEMLAQRPPFAGDSPQKVLQSIQQGEPPRPSDLNPNVPRAVDAIILRMLAAQPADRMPGVPIVRGELQRLMEGLGLESGEDAGPEEPTLASAPPAIVESRPEPRLRTPEPTRTPEPIAPREHAPTQDAAWSALDGDDATQHRKQIIDREVFDRHRATMERASREPTGSRTAIFAGLVLALAVFGAGVTGYSFYSSHTSQQAIAPATAAEKPRPSAPSPVAETAKEPVAAFGAWKESTKPVATERIPLAKNDAPVTVSGAPRPIAPPPVAEPIKEPATPVADAQPKQEPPGTLLGLKPPPSNPLAAEPAPAPLPKSLAASAPEQPAPARAAPVKEQPRAAQPAAKAAEQQPRGRAQLVLAVSPGGELYIDGKYLGDTPATTTFNLEPGMYRVEVRSGSRKPYVTYMTLEAGDVRRIKHDFDAKPSRPPA
jgi:serine/threonine protein kinase